MQLLVFGLAIKNIGQGCPFFNPEELHWQRESSTLKKIGTVHSTRKQMIDDNWDQEKSYIELTPEFSSESLMGLTDFSHAEILFHMDQVDLDKIETTTRHPRNNTNWPKVGIFSQRGKNRPNAIGLTVCEILKVEGTKLSIAEISPLSLSKLNSISSPPSSAQ